MALTEKQIDEIDEVGGDFLKAQKFTKEVKDKLGISYRIDEQSVLIYILKLGLGKPYRVRENAIAKASFVKTQNHWRVFSMHSDKKWHSHKPQPTVKSIDTFFALVDYDEHGSFFG